MGSCNSTEFLLMKLNHNYVYWNWSENDNCNVNLYFTRILTGIFQQNHDFLFLSWLKDSQQSTNGFFLLNVRSHAVCHTFIHLCSKPKNGNWNEIWSNSSRSKQENWNFLSNLFRYIFLRTFLMNQVLSILSSKMSNRAG